MSGLRCSFCVFLPSHFILCWLHLQAGSNMPVALTQIMSGPNQQERRRDKVLFCVSFQKWENLPWKLLRLYLISKLGHVPYSNWIAGKGNEIIMISLIIWNSINIRSYSHHHYRILFYILKSSGSWKCFYCPPEIGRVLEILNKKWISLNDLGTWEVILNETHKFEAVSHILSVCPSIRDLQNRIW